MLPAAARMRRRAEFTAAVRRGRRISTPALTLHVVPATPGLSPMPRIGFVVATSVGPSVVRNTVRRRLRHLLRERLADLPPATAIVVRVRPGAATLSAAELGGQLDDALRRVTRATPVDAAQVTP